MSAERIAAAGVAPVSISGASPKHVISDGSFLDAVQIASAAKPVSAVPAVPAAAVQNEQANTEITDPFYYEDETWTPTEESESFFGDDGISFGDFVDIINPLQHIPIISSIYRSLTGDEISPASRLAGGALYGGPIGLASAFVSGVVEDTTDTSLGDIVVAAFTGDDDADTATQLAAIAPASGNASNTPGSTPAFAARPASETIPTPEALIAAAQTTTPVTTQPLPAQLDPIAAALGQTKSAPSPLAFARDLLESSKPGLVSPSSSAARSIIAADEKMRNQPEMPDPVSAVLSARTQVPRGGAIGGLASYRQSPVVSQSPAPEQNLGQVPYTNNAAAAPAEGRSAQPGVRSADAAIVPGKRGAPPLRTNVATNMSPRRRSAAATAVPNSMVPKAMMSALDKYENMLQVRKKPDEDLTM